jgi:hypothetical protein
MFTFVDEVELLPNGVGDLIEENGHVGIAVWTVIPTRPRTEQVQRLQVISVPVG